MQNFLRHRPARAIWVKWAHLGDMCRDKLGRANAQRCGRQMLAVAVVMLKSVTVVNATRCSSAMSWILHSVIRILESRGSPRVVQAQAYLLTLRHTVTQEVPTPSFVAIRQHRPERRGEAALLQQRCSSRNVTRSVQLCTAPSHDDRASEM